MVLGALMTKMKSRDLMTAEQRENSNHISAIGRNSGMSIPSYRLSKIRAGQIAKTGFGRREESIKYRSEKSIEAEGKRVGRGRP